MARLTGTLRSLALSLLAGGALALGADAAEAQGRGRKSGHDKEKRAEREFRRLDRGGRLDDRVAVRRSDRGRYDGRYDDRFDRRDRDGDRYGRARRPVLSGRSSGFSRVPPGQYPRPGLCRIWIDGVPPGRQPRATDCATARRYVPANARILYGGPVRGRYDDRRDDRWDDRYDDRRDGRYDDRRDDRSRDRRIEGRLPDGRSIPRIPLPWP